MRNLIFAVSVLAGLSVFAAPVVKVVGHGVERTVVTIECPSQGNGAEFVKSLTRNLERSGHFRVGAGGSVKVVGNPGVTAVEATGAGKKVSTAEPFADAKAARMAARRFSDKMVESFTQGGKGYATTRIAFVNRKGSDNAELYVCYPDGYDIRQLTSDGRAAVGPRWTPNAEDIYYTGFLQKTPQVYRLNVATGKRKLLASFKGLSTGAAIAPDGRRAAIILSYQGNAELYVLDLSSGVASRLTTTPAASEASPCWSPDGAKIAYVSDQTRQPQVYVVDVASRKSSLFTRTGRQNTHPDWSADGKLTWSSLRGGQWQVMVADAASGEKSARAVTKPGSWQDPSWAADNRHIVAARDNAIFIVDSDPEEESAPVQVFHNSGNWMNPAFSRR